MSTFKDAVSSGFDEYQERLRVAIEGLTSAELRWQPTMHTNHIAWLVCHMARVEDAWISRLQQGSAQVWTAEGWADRFQMDPVGIGSGDTSEDIREMPEIPLSDLMAYFNAVRDVTPPVPRPDHRKRPFESVPISGPGSIRDLNLGTHPSRGKSTHGPGAMIRGMLHGLGA